MTITLSQVHRAATKLKSALRRAPLIPTREEVQAAERKAGLSSKGKAALTTAYSASWPGGAEFRIDPKRADIERVLANAEARLKKADVNHDGKVTPKELATIKPKSTLALAAFATEFK